MRIIISRTDSIGDVVLTLPVAGMLKQHYPACTIIFLGSGYTRPVIESCRHVDECVSWEPSPAPQGGEVGESVLEDLHADAIIHVFPVKEICLAARRARIPVRIATARRFFTWFTCNRLLHVPRKNSSLHESQLNLKLLKGLGINRHFTLEEIAGMYGLASGQADRRTDQWSCKNFDQTLIPNKRKTIILHPKSKGSAREWGLDNFARLIGLLPEDKYEILVTGTADEGAMMRPFLDKHRGRVTDLTGRLSLAELMGLISLSDALVAASTGPLHLAAALGIRAVGLYAPMRPIFPQRWAPVGDKATFLVLDKSCNDCRKTSDCACIRAITPEAVLEKLLKPKSA